MANTAAPFGAKAWGGVTGTQNFANSNPNYQILYTYNTPIFFGDLVRLNVSGPSGNLERWTAADGGTATQIPVGIFQGCRFYSVPQRTTVWSNYWPGANVAASGSVQAFVAYDPTAEWEIQASAGPITAANLGQTADVVMGSGNTTTGISTMALDTPTTTITFPFKVVGLIETPPGVNGTDITTAYNRVIVAFNNQMFKNNLGV